MGGCEESHKLQMKSKENKNPVKSLLQVETEVAQDKLKMVILQRIFKQEKYLKYFLFQKKT